MPKGETFYFRVPAMVDHSADPKKDGSLPELGLPAFVTRDDREYVPDDNGIIAVTHPEDAEQFRLTAGYTEIVGASELPSATPSKQRAVSEAQGARTAGGSK